MNSWGKESESFRRFHMQRQTVQSQPLENDDARRSGSKKVWIETEHTATAEIGKVLLQVYRNATCPVLRLSGSYSSGRSFCDSLFAVYRRNPLFERGKTIIAWPIAGAFADERD